MLILEEAAYVDPGFFYETVAPLTIVGSTSLLAISTLTSEINFYTRLIRMRDKQTGKAMFQVIHARHPRGPRAHGTPLTPVPPGRSRS